LSTFISYSRADSGFAIRLAKDLRSAGYDVWLDQLDIPTGSRWDDEVEFALENCTTFLIILSPESLQSQNVKDEIGYAIDAGKNILPVKIKSGEIPFRLRRFQYVDFSNKPYAESLKEIKTFLPKELNVLSTIQIEKRLVGEELEALLDATGSAGLGPAGQPTKPRIPAIKQVPARKRSMPIGLMISLLAVAGLIAAGLIFNSARSKEARATAVPTEVLVAQLSPTEKPTARATTDTGQVALTQAAASKSLVINFSEDPDLTDWERIVKGNGRASKISTSPAKDGLVFDLNDPDLRTYYFYRQEVDQDVAIRWRAENLGKSNYIVGLICRRSGEAWYEFRVTGDGLWSLLKYNTTYLPVDSGGTKDLKVGKNVNEFEMDCAGNQITARINGQTVTTYDFRTSYYTQGQVGFTISSRQDVFPIDIKAMEFEVSRPGPG
jgi:hypothetical protein